jgi:hypothetical protein
MFFYCGTISLVTIYFYKGEDDMKKTSIGMKNLISHINTALNNNLFLTAFAEENPAEPPKNEGTTMNFEHLIAQARREEKEKLYPQIEKLKAQAEVLTKQINEALLAKGAAEKELADLKESQKKGDSEEVTKLKAQIEALKSDNENLKKNTVSEEDLRKKLEEEYQVKLYAKDKLAENKDKILSVFAEKVVGNTKEEIDLAIEKAIASSDEIRKELGVEDKKKPEKKDNKDNKGKKENNSQNNPPAPNPQGGEGEKGKFDLEYIQSLDPRSEEYAKWRKSVGLK